MVEGIANTVCRAIAFRHQWYGVSRSPISSCCKFCRIPTGPYGLEVSTKDCSALSTPATCRKIVDQKGMAVDHERTNVFVFPQENNTECRGTTIRWSDGIFQPVLYAAPTSRRYRLHCTPKTDHITPFTSAHRPDAVSICDCTVSKLTSRHLGLECGLTYFCSLVPRCSTCRPHSASVPGKFRDVLPACG